MVQNYIEATLKQICLKRAGRTILRDIEWTIRPGERWVLAGGNGAGKTQLLKLVAGSVWPTPTPQGKRLYRLRRRRAALDEAQAQIAYLGSERQDRYERYGWNHTVEQVVGTGLYRTDIPLDPLTAPDRRRIGSVLTRLSIAHLAPRSFLTLSYGERRLVLLARALASRPRLLLLDELLNGLDARHRAQALRWLHATRRGRLPWVLSTHRLDDVPAGATHALVLVRGRVIFRGSLARAPLERWLGGVRQRPRASQPTAARSPGRPLVRLRRAWVYLDERAVLQDISLQIDAGSCWVVHGRNGSGKSTLLRTIYGDHSVAARGSIERAGIATGVPLDEFKRRVGLVAPHLQADHPQHLTVAEVVQSGRHASIGLAAAPSVADVSAARGALAFFGLGRYAARPLSELSYGQLRRVLFARAWINEPVLLLLDEPFAGVDAPTRRSLGTHLAQLVARGTSLVLATHHRAEWPHCATHEIELEAGRSLYCGPLRGAASQARRDAR
jgi:molybdate transport system ATP-binding protein